MNKILLFGFLASISLFSQESVQEQRMGYTENRPWEKRQGKGYDGYYKVAPKDLKSEKKAEWTVDLPQTGRTYGVYATWVAEKANTRNAAYIIYDGEKGLGEVRVNQQQPPRGKVIRETPFQKLGTFPFTSRVIRIILTSQPDGQVVSDSVMVLPE